ncbi:hypothetical protein SAMN04487765_0814 [Tenacibaculum sp. MAR_2010_89]|uniref:hypothetical protein n=1 Tax=Tenacibaculum sp. MAR_2010_89 TaxID=1250198 RepID=UPI0008961CAE|nr:hypothetical protein [Tenacibaculum sp. MAR_2010_89]SED92635.1 hypothetical protein SAMN04487765_0814 [Tenacibaculum sp. MAR_2010_89]
MKELKLNELSVIQGGDWGDVVDGTCTAVAAGGLLTLALGLTNPVGAGVYGFCAGWGFVRILTS